MKKKILVVVDMQNDFTIGPLGTVEAVEIIPKVVEKVESAIADGVPVVFTRDTHDNNYLDTQEGRMLPVPHCIKETRGWAIIPELRPYVNEFNPSNVYDKHTFASGFLATVIAADGYEEVELVGVRTDICMLCNAIVIKEMCPETVITVDASCCAGVTPERHRIALEAMKACQIIVKE